MASWRGLSTTETSEDQLQKKSEPHLSLSNQDPRTGGWVWGKRSGTLAPEVESQTGYSRHRNVPSCTHLTFTRIKAPTKDALSLVCGKENGRKILDRYSLPVLPWGVAGVNLMQQAGPGNASNAK